MPPGCVVPLTVAGDVNGPPEPAAPHALAVSVCDWTVSVDAASPDCVPVCASLKSVREPIAKPVFVVVLVEPPAVAATPLTVSAPPAGAVVSGLNAIELVAVLPAASAPTTLCVGVEDVPAVQLNAFETYGPPNGEVCASGVVCDQPVEVP